MNKQALYNAAPYWVKNLLVTIFNLRQKPIHGARYHSYLKIYEDFFYHKSFVEIKAAQNSRFMELINLVRTNNEYYKQAFAGIEINSIADITKLPILTKDNLREPSIKTALPAGTKLLKGNTGGTTGKSLLFAISQEDYAERQANLDFFRGQFGYKFGDEIAWFSGKEIITPKEVKKKKFWVRDRINKVTYYSTFHMKEEFVLEMIKDIEAKKPAFMAGFPSAIYDIAVYWKKHRIAKPTYINAVFPTSEPLFEHQKALIGEVFNCPVPDQYASSEGAPFIYECTHGKLHYDMYSGIFEPEEPNNPDSEVLVTSFTTSYMPLIRYKVGDKVKFADPTATCTCGSAMPLIDKIEGRSVAFVFSKERGKVTVSNISNVVKYIPNIDKFQLVQAKPDAIDVYVVYSGEDSEANVQKSLDYELRYRLGDQISLNYHFVEDIPVGKNGKFRMVVNSLKPEDVNQ